MDLEGGTVYEDGVLKVKGLASSSSIRACYKKANIFSSVSNTATLAIKTSQGPLDLAKLYNAVLECGGLEKVIIPPLPPPPPPNTPHHHAPSPQPLSYRLKPRKLERTN